MPICVSENDNAIFISHSVILTHGFSKYYCHWVTLKLCLREDSKGNEIFNINLFKI